MLSQFENDLLEFLRTDVASLLLVEMLESLPQSFALKTSHELGEFAEEMWFFESAPG